MTMRVSRSAVGDADAAMPCQSLEDGAPNPLPAPSCRECWWGEKQHCTFYGLKAMGMGYPGHRQRLCRHWRGVNPEMRLKTTVKCDWELNPVAKASSTMGTSVVDNRLCALSMRRRSTNS